MSRDRSRRARRRRITETYTNKVELPGPLKFITNPKVFLVMGIIFVVALVGGLMPILGSQPTGDQALRQAGELEDAPPAETNAEGTPVPTTPVATVKRYDAPPPLVIDPSRRYLVTVATTRGEFQIELVANVAPEAVNNFVFLAREGYYNGTQFMQVVTNTDGSRFVAQAGDPTGTGLTTPGYTIRKEQTSLPFNRGAVGMDSGQFFISYGDYPSLTGKHTIMGNVVAGMDVVERLNLLDVRKRDGSKGDQIVSIRIDEL